MCVCILIEHAIILFFSLFNLVSDQNQTVLSFPYNVGDSFPSHPGAKHQGAAAVPDDDNDVFTLRSHLPRPTVLGRSESSGSSRAGKSPSGSGGGSSRNAYDNLEGDSKDETDEDDLLGTLVSGGMPKSKSEPLDLKGKVKLREKKVNKDKDRRKSSPRNSKVIPGVKINELKLKPRSRESTPPVTQQQLQQPRDTGCMAVSDIWTDDSPNLDGAKPIAGPEDEEGVDGNDNMMVVMVEDDDDTLTISSVNKSSGEKILPANEKNEDRLTVKRVEEDNKKSTTPGPPLLLRPPSSPRIPDFELISGGGETDSSLTDSAMIRYEAEKVCHAVQEDASSMISSICSNISAIQPPSMMESLISMAGGSSSSNNNSCKVGGGGGSNDNSLASCNTYTIESVAKTGSSSSSGTPPPAFKIAGGNNENSSSNNNNTTTTIKMECRHTLSAKKGLPFPMMVSRALGVVAGGGGVGGGNTAHSSNEDLTSSMSSCQSNLDNIKPPTIMDEMDNSILSIASLSSEVADSADAGGAAAAERIKIMGSSAESGHCVARSSSSRSLGSEQILDSANADQVDKNNSSSHCCSANVVSNGTNDSPTLTRKLMEEEDVSCLNEAPDLDDIAPPTTMDEVSGALLTSRTLVAPGPAAAAGATYTVNGEGEIIINDDHDQSTCRDITDVFDDDTTTIEPTITLESDNNNVEEDDAPELPRDSRHSTPASSKSSSREHTPKSKRKGATGVATTTTTTTTHLQQNLDNIATPLNVDYYKQFHVPVPDIDESSPSSEINGQGDTSGYRSETVTQSSKSSRQRRKDDSDRFRTHTITKDDISPKMSLVNRFLKNDDSDSSSNSCSSSKRPPRSVKRRREEEADRFKTQTISASDLSPRKLDFDSSDDTPQNNYNSSGSPFAMSPVEIKLLEKEAKLVVDVIDERKSSIRSRSSSADYILEKSMNGPIEIMNVKDLHLNMEIRGSDPCFSVHEFTNDSSKKGPRICKPGEAETKARETEEVRGIRGRRKALLYSTPPKRATAPPSISPKPALAPKPRSIRRSAPFTVANVLGKHGGIAQNQIRGTRTSNLRQGRMNSPPSPKMSVRSYGSVSSSSSVRSASSARSAQTPSIKSSSTTTTTTTTPMVRQGTFTKEDSSSSSPNQSGEETMRQQSLSIPPPPPKIPPKPSIRKDLIHPMMTSRPLKNRAYNNKLANSENRDGNGNSRDSVSSSVGSRSRMPRIAQTKTSQLRERSGSTQKNRGLSRESVSNLLQLHKNGPSSSSNSSLNSIRSSKSNDKNMRPSNSSHSLRAVPENGKTDLPMSRKSHASPSSSTSAVDVRKRKTASWESSSPRNKTDDDDTSIAAAAADGGGGGPKKEGKKAVTSKIASLWKQVEDSKKKRNRTKEIDQRVWIAKGKVIPENELALLKPHLAQREIINDFQMRAAARATSSTTTAAAAAAAARGDNHVATTSGETGHNVLFNRSIKPTTTTISSSSNSRSRSRLSMKLSKFSKGSKKDKEDFRKTPTSPPSTATETQTLSSSPSRTDTSPDGGGGGISSLAFKTPDCINRNQMMAPPLTSCSTGQDTVDEISLPGGGRQQQSNLETEQQQQLQHSSFSSPDLLGGEEPVTNITMVDDDDRTVRRLSRLGSFFNPDMSSAPSDNNAVGVIKFRSSNRSPAPASAIVPPFNYSPPIVLAEMDPSPMSDLNAPDSTNFSIISRSSSTSGLTSSRLSCYDESSASQQQQVKRNDSYVSSMGRRETDAAASPGRRQQKKTNNKAAAAGRKEDPTSSVLVTLV